MSWYAFREPPFTAGRTGGVRGGDREEPSCSIQSQPFILKNQYGSIAESTMMHSAIGYP